MMYELLNMSKYVKNSYLVQNLFKIDYSILYVITYEIYANNYLRIRSQKY